MSILTNINGLIANYNGYANGHKSEMKNKPSTSGIDPNPGT